MTGFYCVKVGRCQVPCCLTFNFFPGCEDFFLYPAILPVPMCFPCALSGCAMSGFVSGHVVSSVLVLSGMSGDGSGGNRGNPTAFGELVPIDEARAAPSLAILPLGKRLNSGVPCDAQERGTLAFYTYACCSGGKLTEYPCLTCTKQFASKSDPRLA